MPRGDRRGPDGMGPMTGHGAGYCASNTAPGMTTPGGRGRGGGGFGRGGGGRRHRHWYYATGLPGWQRPAAQYAPPPGVAFGPQMTKEEELEILKAELHRYEQALDDLHGRIREIEASTKDETSEHTDG